MFIAIWLPWPPTVPVNGQSMNYGGPVMGAVILFGIADWFLGSRKRFGVPKDVGSSEYEGD